MPTPYSAVYKRALSKITDPDFLLLFHEEKEELLKEYLVSAATEFNRICLHDLTDVDDDAEQFNQELDSETIEILACGMCYYWMEPIVQNSDNFRLFLNTKDFNTASPSNLLGKIQEIRNYNRHLFLQKMRAYSYYNNDL